MPEMIREWVSYDGTSTSWVYGNKRGWLVFVTGSPFGWMVGWANGRVDGFYKDLDGAKLAGEEGAQSL